MGYNGYCAPSPPPPPKITRVRRKEGTKVHYKVVYELYVENTYHGVSGVNCVCKGRQNLECWNQRRHVDTSRYLQCVCILHALLCVCIYALHMLIFLQMNDSCNGEKFDRDFIRGLFPDRLFV